jgi:hypothetical protein
VHGLVARAGDPTRERWLDQVRGTGACRHPVRLRAGSCAAATSSSTRRLGSRTAR